MLGHAQAFILIGSWTGDGVEGHTAVKLAHWTSWALQLAPGHISQRSGSVRAPSK